MALRVIAASHAPNASRLRSAGSCFMACRKTSCTTTALSAAVAIIMLLVGRPAAAEPGDLQQYTVDRGASTVAFTVSARALFTLKKDGVFNDFSGLVSYDPADPAATRMDLTIYTASVDLRNPGQEELLRSAEFFDADHHPTMRFVSTGAVPRADGGLDVAGDLTIRGVTRHLVVPMRILPRTGSTPAAFDSNFQIDRTEFGLNGGGPKARSFKVSIGKTVGIHLAIAPTKTALG